MSGQGGQGVVHRDVVQQAVDGADPERIAGRVDQEHQSVVPGAGGGVLRAEGAVRRPAMVAVGDERLVVGELGPDAGHGVRVGDRPQAGAEAVLRGRGQERRLRGRAFHEGGGERGPAVAPVGQQQGFEVRPGRPHERRAVRDDMGHDVLVRQDHLLGGVRHAHGTDDAALQQVLAVALFVDVQARFGVGGQDALRRPAVQGAGGLLVARLGGGGLGEDQPDDVVGVGRFEVEQTVGADHHVVGG